MRGAFINQTLAQCSIYESGLMVYNTLKTSDAYILDYFTWNDLFAIKFTQYDFCVFNWHDMTTPPECTEFIKGVSIKKFTVVTEMLPETPVPRTPIDLFDGYLVIDPTIQDRGNIYGMPRPIQSDNTPFDFNTEGVRIGSFGFATPGKNFDLVISVAAQSFDTPVVAINLPRATFVPTDSELRLERELQSFNDGLSKPVQLEITHQYFTQQELINWCRQNTLNVFFYDRNMAGLSAVTDQAIVAQRPILVSSDKAFRHMHPYLSHYPYVSMQEAILNSMIGVEKMLDDWAPSKFCEKFEAILCQR